MKGYLDLIHEYYENEFGEDQPIEDFIECPLAYSTDGDGEHELQVTANLIARSYSYYIDNELLFTEYAKDEEEFASWLGCIDFDVLIGDCENMGRRYGRID